MRDQIGEVFEGFKEGIQKRKNKSVCCVPTETFRELEFFFC